MSAISDIRDKKWEDVTDAEKCFLEAWETYGLESLAESGAAELADPLAENEQLKAQNKVLVEFLKQIEFDEVTGECMIGCNGDSIDGHGEDCIWSEPYLTAALTGDA